MKQVLSALFLICSFFVHGQVNYNQLPAVKLANLDTAFGSYSEVLSYPRLTTGLATCEVTGFTVQFTIKDGATFGPFTNQTPMLTDEEKVIIKNLRYDKVNILFTNISLRCDGQVVHPQPFTFYMGY